MPKYTGKYILAYPNLKDMVRAGATTSEDAMVTLDDHTHADVHDVAHAAGLAVDSVADRLENLSSKEVAVIRSRRVTKPKGEDFLTVDVDLYTNPSVHMIKTDNQNRRSFIVNVEDSSDVDQDHIQMIRVKNTFNLVPEPEPEA